MTINVNRVLMGAAGAAGGGAPPEEYFWVEITTTSSTNDSNAYGVRFDDNGNIYSIFTREAATNLSCVVSIDGTGALNFIEGLNPASGFVSGRFMAATPDGDNIAFSRNGSSTPDITHLVKRNNSGVIQWQKELSKSGQNDEEMNQLYADSSGNLTVFNRTKDSPTGVSDALVIRLSSAGAITWQKKFGQSSKFANNRGGIDDSGNAYLVTGLFQSGQSTRPHVTAKISNTGAITWQRQFSTTGKSFPQGGVDVDSSGNVYVGIHNDSDKSLIVVKYNSSGTLQWQRELSGNPSGIGDIDSVDDVAVDTSDNVYVVCKNGTSTRGFMVFKWNSSGTFQWQRLFRTASGTDNVNNPFRIHTFSDLAFAVSASSSVSSPDSILLVRLPADGSLTGTYGAYEYSTPTYSESASSHTDAAGSLSANDGDYSVSTPTDTQTTPGSTLNKTAIE